MYVTTVIGVIVLLCGINCIDKYRKGRCQPPNGQQINPANNDVLEIEERLYDSIDENINMSENMVNINDANGNEYLEVINRSDNSESITDEDIDATSYLNLYQSLTRGDSAHDYETNNTSDSTVITNESETVNHNTQAYLNLYQQLNGNRWLTSHVYEMPPMRKKSKCQITKSRPVSLRSLKLRYNKMKNDLRRRFSF